MSKVPRDIAAFGRPRLPSAAKREGRPETPPRQTIVTIPPPEVEPIPTAKDFFRILRTAALAAGAGNQVVSTALRYQASGGIVAAIKFVSIFVDAPTALTNVVWSVLLNGAPAPGFDALTFSPRVAANFERTFPCTIRVPPNTTVQVVITNQDAAGPWTVGASFGGWGWNQQEGERYTGLPYLYVR